MFAQNSWNKISLRHDTLSLYIVLCVITRWPRLRCAKMKKTMSEEKKKKKALFHKDNWDTIIVRTGIMGSSFRQSALEWIHGVALVYKAIIWSRMVQIQTTETQITVLPQPLTPILIFQQPKLMLSAWIIYYEDISVISFFQMTYWGLTWQMMPETFVITWWDVDWLSAFHLSFIC